MKKIIMAIAILTMTTTAYALDLDMAYNYGQTIYSNSGQTFKGSDKNDKDWNGSTSQIEATLWDKTLGVYAYYGSDNRVNEQMFKNLKYSNKIDFIGVGAKLKYRFFDCLDGYIGAGVNQTVMENTYTQIKKNKTKTIQEDLRSFGPDVVVGVQWFPSENSGWFIGVNGRYSWNTVASTVYEGTDFSAPGLRYFGAVGYRW